ncbi:hypothetical protein ACFOD9_11340 [Novosphingobium bradum]|uniref:Uncharacterized protein n=1 Tax=Novosphingobium bradum TaxID=1737444 RepID=A0ABV7IQA8_9SPHN
MALKPGIMPASTRAVDRAERQAGPPDTAPPGNALPGNALPETGLMIGP